MRLVCAWCGSKLKSSRPGGRGGISYGICLPCANRILSSTPGMMRDYIDQMDSPVALLNGDGVVVTANRLACVLLHKELAQIEGLKCGEVFGCAGPGGPTACGTNGECAGCEIGRCVAHTHRTGRGVSAVPAHVQTEQDAEDSWWLISTSKFLDCVVLRIAGKTRVRKSGKVRQEGERGSARSARSGAVPTGHSSQRRKRGTGSPVSEGTVPVNMASGLTHSPLSP